MCSPVLYIFDGLLQMLHLSPIASSHVSVQKEPETTPRGVACHVMVVSWSIVKIIYFSKSDACRHSTSNPCALPSWSNNTYPITPSSFESCLVVHPPSSHPLLSLHMPPPIPITLAYGNTLRPLTPSSMFSIIIVYITQINCHQMLFHPLSSPFVQACIRLQRTTPTMWPSNLYRTIPTAWPTFLSTHQIALYSTRHPYHTIPTLWPANLHSTIPTTGPTTLPYQPCVQPFHWQNQLFPVMSHIPYQQRNQPCSLSTTPHRRFCRFI